MGYWLLAVAAVMFGLYNVFIKVSAAVGNPLIIGGSILVTTGVGFVLLREPVNPLQLAAIFLIAVGIVLLAWDSVPKG
ncbi:MAG TPA: hypothetical protein VFG91_02860 [Woeseiaceae bacterium]|nr:hypothetical protein [Woeseiaceae bacterium]